MKLANNLGRPKISDEFEFRLDQTVHVGVNCPKMLHKFSHILIMEKMLSGGYRIHI